jgi:hypothetical protein
MQGKYTIELFRSGGEGAGVDQILMGHDDLTIARKLYKQMVRKYRGRLVMLCDRARILARSDRPDTMPD